MPNGKVLVDRNGGEMYDCKWIARKGMWEGTQSNGVRTLFHVKRDGKGQPVAGVPRRFGEGAGNAPTLSPSN